MGFPGLFLDVLQEVLLRRSPGTSQKYIAYFFQQTKPSYVPKADVAGVCKEIGLYDGSTIEVKGFHKGEEGSN